MRNGNFTTQVTTLKTLKTTYGIIIVIIDQNRIVKEKKTKTILKAEKKLKN